MRDDDEVLFASETGGQDPVIDVPLARPVLSREVRYGGPPWSMVVDRVDLGEGGVVDRAYLDHPGAVAIMVLDDEDRVLLQRQYRHPVRHELWEPPAGLLDAPQESPLTAAQRELAEEADLRAASWHVLVDYYPSPGSSNEAIRVFVARDLSDVPDDERYVRGEEELGMESRWVAIPDAVRWVLGGAVQNPSAVIGVLALAATDGGRVGVRDADDPWRGTRERDSGASVSLSRGN